MSSRSVNRRWCLGRVLAASLCASPLLSNQRGHAGWTQAYQCVLHQNIAVIRLHTDSTGSTKKPPACVRRLHKEKRNCSSILSDMFQQLQFIHRVFPLCDSPLFTHTRVFTEDSDHSRQAQIQHCHTTSSLCLFINSPSTLVKNY